MTHDALRGALGAYVLGALVPSERAAIDIHLSECAQCRETLMELAPLPGLLGRLSPDEVASGFAPPSTRPVDEAIRIVGQHQRARRRRLRAWQALAAAALASLAVIVLPGSLLQGSTRSLRLQPQATTQGEAQIAGFVAVTATDWGMEVEVQLQGLPPRRGYSLVAVADDDHRTTAASWAPTDTGVVALTGACYLALDRLARMEVVSSDGEVLTVFDV